MTNYKLGKIRTAKTIDKSLYKKVNNMLDKKE